MRTSFRVAATAAGVAFALGAALHVPANAADADTSAVSTEIVVRAAAEADSAAAAKAAVAAMSVAEQAASVVMGHIPSTDASALRSYMESTGIGGFILMGANIPADEASLRALTAALTVDSARPPLISIDQEGGDVSRLPWDGFPSARTLKDAPPEAAEDAFAGRAALVRRAGIGVNFGIVADATSDPASFIYRRALGTTPASAAERVAAAVRGEGITAASTLKHFPGHGAAPGDSHSSIPSTSMSFDDWRANDAQPFAAGIDAGAPLLMYGHLAYTSVDPAPASLSAEWHRIARDDLGFEGVAITDDLGMLQGSGLAQYTDPVANAVASIAAGNDMVLTVVGSTPETALRTAEGIAAAVEAGSLPADRLREAAERVMALRLEFAAEGRGLVPCATCEPVG
ncbi:glycoside hydrolase family 3 N-terminal domain-containing protein [Microbacterium sp. CPCC 204701]|uniref:glycoside hydrolase family 3 N-terminal domain-containing protein n=1 Tax=Microbacterium sp. CPCC 204701 TaxID=2493084 RepID=UPI001F0C5841|nr:glycoside hydrolase family 3 N-terminal domain-containing protein [Microbacterium sp. CPCC 204701]